jgi:hypothetical protein
MGRDYRLGEASAEYGPTGEAGTPELKFIPRPKSFRRAKFPTAKLAVILR